ncbi:hypothetical protein BC830DRAFT_901901 [Chytriomyces sp. MP71]|nr:hypothetical protein BC830DRAFT_901901 [Chytriomyces sp. MP71]
MILARTQSLKDAKGMTHPRVGVEAKGGSMLSDSSKASDGKSLGLQVRIRPPSSRGSGSVDSILSLGSKSPSVRSKTKSKSESSILGSLPESHSEMTSIHKEMLAELTPRLPTKSSLKKKPATNPSSATSGRTVLIAQGTMELKLDRKVSIREETENIVHERHRPSRIPLPSPPQSIDNVNDASNQKKPANGAKSMATFRLESLKLLLQQPTSSGASPSRVPLPIQSTNNEFDGANSQYPAFPRPGGSRMSSRETSQKDIVGKTSGSLTSTMQLSEPRRASFNPPKTLHVATDSIGSSKSKTVDRSNVKTTSFTSTIASQKSFSDRSAALSSVSNTSPISIGSSRNSESLFLDSTPAEGYLKAATRHGRSPSGNGRETLFSIRPTVKSHPSQSSKTDKSSQSSRDPSISAAFDEPLGSLPRPRPRTATSPPVSSTPPQTLENSMSSLPRAANLHIIRTYPRPGRAASTTSLDQVANFSTLSSEESSEARSNIVQSTVSSFINTLRSRNSTITSTHSGRERTLMSFANTGGNVIRTSWIPKFMSK